VLKHHPDKKKESGTRERDIFTCITKAFEQLSDPVKRMSYDSVDPKFKDDVPVVSENNKKNFYKVFGDAIARNVQWSTKKNVPLLGDDKATFEQVNHFYQFWYDFDSWREFSYEDEENKETAQDRDERRWIEKENKAVRAKKKKEEVTRIRKLVGM
jgi:DnaJ family protein C protein 2